LTLINNDGFSKRPHEGLVIKSYQAKDVLIRLNNNFIRDKMENQQLNKITNLMNDSVIWDSDGSKNYSDINIRVEPGDIQILQFAFN
jgi:hypothetical protein